MRQRNDRHVILPARGRLARLGRRPLVATVSLGFARAGMEGMVYRHPEVQIGTLDTDGAVTYCGPRVKLRFQTHAMDMGDRPHDRRGPGGFLRMGSGRWVGCYGAEIMADYGSEYAGREITRVIAIVNRARRIWACGSQGCDLLQLLIGLQRIGVEVRIYREARFARREASLAA